MSYNLNAGYGGAMGPALTARTTGKTFYLQSTTYADQDLTTSLFPPDIDGVTRLFNTTTLATAACTASAGDVIYVAPGYTETISSSTALTLSKAGVTIIGLGTGSLRPTFTLDTANTATINVTANNITIQNCIFVANFLAIASCFTLTTASDFVLDNCEFRDTSSVLNFVAIVTTNTTSTNASGLKITNSTRIGAGATTNTTIVSMLGTNDRVTIKDNYFAHAAVTAAGLMIIATGKVVTNAIIDGNACNFVGATNTTTGILITTNGTTNSGIIRRNMVQSLDATSEILVTASSGFIYFNNYYSGTADLSGYLLPAADA